MEMYKAGYADVSMLARMNKKLIEDEKHPSPMNIGQLTDRMRNWISKEYMAYLLKEGNSIIGYCLYRDDGDFFYLRQLYIERDQRRKGDATYLLNWMYDNVWEDKKVRLDVLSHNKAAIEFYKKYGFRTECYRMEK